MARYWVDLGSWDFLIDDTEDEKERKREEKAQEIMEFLSNSVTDMSNLVYKTDNLEDAKKVYSEAKKTLLKIFGDKAEAYLMLLDITRQPECPKCGKLGRFTDTFCARCGSKLIGPEKFEVD